MLGSGLGIWTAIDLLEGAATIIPTQNPRSDVLARVLAELETSFPGKGYGGSEINKNSLCVVFSGDQLGNSPLLY